jgi:hypothetical protein
MKRLAWMLAAILVAVTTAACGSSSEPSCTYSSTFQQNLQGTWSQCAPAQSGVGYAKTTLTVSCLDVTFVNVTYTDANCTTQTIPPVQVTAPATVVIGSAVPNTAWVGGSPAPVTAYPLAIAIPSLSMSIYTLGYIDTGVTPNKLYTGGFNTSLPYPTTLYPIYPFTKQ